MKSEAEIFAHFQKTNIQEAEEILRFLHTLLWAINQIALKGKRPDLTNFSDYDSWVKGLKCKTEEFIRQLP